MDVFELKCRGLKGIIVTCEFNGVIFYPFKYYVVTDYISKG